MEPFISVASLTKYPKLFKTKTRSTYWAQYQPSKCPDGCTPEIINNRNKFIEDNKINKFCGYSWGSRTRNKKINNILGADSDNRRHIECYKTSDNKFILICTSADHEYMISKGHSATNKLYHTLSNSYIIITDL